MNVYKQPQKRTARIASGQTTSDVVDIGDYMAVGLVTPAALTGTAITFLASVTRDGAYVPVYDSDGNQVSVDVAASRAVGLSGAELDALAPFRWLKLVSNAAEAADREITVVLK